MTADQLDLLTAVAENPTPIAEGYRNRIRAAIVADAREHGGEVNPNRVRARLLHPASGRLDVDPRILSATYAALRAQGVLVHDGWTTNGDTAGRNGGKPLRLWRLVGEAS
jgi:hypothetical protein